MTPQLDSQQLAAHFDSVEGPELVGAHLTAEQFGELLAGSAPDASPQDAFVEAHLLACEQCSAELDELRQSITLFRDATRAYANEQMLHRTRWVLPTRTAHSLRSGYWAAAAAMLLIALLPMQVLYQHARPAQPVAAVSSVPDATQSDEALLEDVDRAISTSVPTPMQALADPTATASNDNFASTSTQRK
jgi:hypothetical protein